MSGDTVAPKESVPSDAAPADARKPNIIVLALAAAATCGAAGAASYMLAPAAFGSALQAPSKPEHSSESGVKKHAADKPAAKKSNDNHGAKPNSKHKSEGDEAESDAGVSKFHVMGSTGVFELRPLVVSLKPQGRVRYLRVTLAIETTPESASAFIESDLRIIDILTSYLRAVPADAIEDPSAMARIREQIARRIAFIVDPAPVNAVLITDFILS